MMASQFFPPWAVSHTQLEVVSGKVTHLPFLPQLELTHYYPTTNLISIFIVTFEKEIVDMVI